ncbi:bifunctional 4-hydroxy-2-oxoglutarate aldolase/2-dehydro-3-deoxy-phosphogluconate aldolase [Microbacterium sp. Au-Mic1]|uniref:bifunctional 4-hydroxy-2-oxoglutarate aldolase/2-dehydro-3-deoxy-phosphogluconate aldolase n=1 Tax=Microbacterium sp. Au-Mic1 TaxID=2906457 RepID=UPI001E392ABE|nr:bifunctional 4-hydroxy-2-oxoglutarate aldolase/2-dehydro-3-deoxy-phosphogluconate aldolase [Microbacterium sp. Au-Mic1]MCE4026269.1 bifunctional 4-hydroxy-2-oxoglutarate aldolase/2-dehydro-3-deoxy-phosphogluconate aldolase [Microbacterium sp. Au-Mic1]
MTSVLPVLKKERIVAILRARSAHRLDAVIDVLVESGIGALEVTLPTPGSLVAIRAAVARHSGVVVGAGTVLTTEDVERAADAGARFIVTPNTDPAVIARARALGLESFPGAMTVTEILTAYRAGAAAVKVFPARAVGAEFFRDVAAPLPDIPLVAVGGVALADIPAYLAAGALGVGLGGPLIGDALEDGMLDGLRERAAAARAAAGVGQGER